MAALDDSSAFYELTSSVASPTSCRGTVRVEYISTIYIIYTIDRDSNIPYVVVDRLTDCSFELRSSQLLQAARLSIYTGYSTLTN